MWLASQGKEEEVALSLPPFPLRQLWAGEVRGVADTEEIIEHQIVVYTATAQLFITGATAAVFCKAARGQQPGSNAGKLGWLMGDGTVTLNAHCYGRWLTWTAARTIEFIFEVSQFINIVEHIFSLSLR
jgi:hypothetical protein